MSISSSFKNALSFLNEVVDRRVGQNTNKRGKEEEKERKKEGASGLGGVSASATRGVREEVRGPTEDEFEKKVSQNVSPKSELFPQGRVVQQTARPKAPEPMCASPAARSGSIPSERVPFQK